MLESVIFKWLDSHLGYTYFQDSFLKSSPAIISTYFRMAIKKSLWGLECWWHIVTATRASGSSIYELKSVNEGNMHYHILSRVWTRDNLFVASCFSLKFSVFTFHSIKCHVDFKISCWPLSIYNSKIKSLSFLTQVNCLSYSSTILVTSFLNVWIQYYLLHFPIVIIIISY